MNPVTVVWSMIAAACLTLAAVHLPVWWRNREARATLAFTLAATSTAAIAILELQLLNSRSVAAYAETLKWGHVPVALMMISLAAFAYHYLDADWPWLAIGGLALRLVSLVLDFTTGVNINYLEITRLHDFTLLGERVAAPEGVPNPWMAIAQLGVILLALFLARATVMTWRRGRRAVAVFVGCSLTFYLAAGACQAFLVYWGLVPAAPSTLSLFSLGVVVVMGYALSVDLLRARRLVLDLREREEEANLAADAANLGIWTRYIARDEIRASDKWRELFGFRPGEQVGTDQVLARIHVDDRATFAKRLTQAAREHGGYQSEFRLVLPDGRLRWIAALGRIDFDARGRALRSRGACIDITARKNTEQEMLRLRQDIAHVSRVSVMGQLASNLAHEINQPLGAILRNAEAATLILQKPAPDLQEIDAILEDIRNDDQRAGEVVDRMRTMLRRRELAMAPLDCGQVLGDVAALLRADAAARHVGLELAVPADLPAVRGDRVQIQQVLLNLILNAMDALDGLDDQSRFVAVTARRQETQGVEISVADSGPGIPADQLERIFEPFVTTKTQGIGMGLSISRGIVETHGGRLRAENNAGRGATFRFTLPLAG
ncbi:MAG: PAS domain-containing protein [Burkholderiales bacterium]|nr:PAS domain-containing protein [Burkholderiales bacterium]